MFFWRVIGATVAGAIPEFNVCCFKVSLQTNLVLYKDKNQILSACVGWGKYM